MKVKFTTLFLLAFLALASSGMAQKIGYTNVELLMAYYPAAQNVEKSVQRYGEELQAPLAVKEKYYQQLISEYYEKKQANMFTKESEEAMIKKIQGIEMELAKDAQEAEGKLMQRQNELMEPVLTKLQETIDQVARDGGYTYILNQTSGSNLLYGAESLDITETIAGKLGINLPKN